MNNFTFQQGKQEIAQKLQVASKPITEWTKYELHKYMRVQWNTKSSAFDAIVGEYEPADVNIEGLQASRQVALLRMSELIKIGKLGALPFTKMVNSSAEVAVHTTGYTITVKDGQVTEVKMVRGVPSTEPAPMILAHHSVTLAMTTSSPEYEKQMVNGLEKRVMKKSVPTDPKGEFYLPTGAMGLVSQLEQYYSKSKNILDVRQRILADAQDAGVLMDVSAISLSSIQNIVQYKKNTKQWKPKWQMFDIIKEIKDKKKQQMFIDAKVDPLEVVLPTELPTYAVNSLSTMWSYLELNRSVRGSDKGKISPLTNAVYYGETDHMYRAITGCADILSIMKATNTTKIAYTPDKYYGKLWSMLQLNVPIFMATSSLPKYDNQPYGYYIAAKATDILHIGCVSQDPPRMNTKTLTWEYTPDRTGSKASIMDYFDLHQNAAMKVYAYDGLWQDFPGQIYPSLHAHSGVVWVCKNMVSPYTEKDHIERVVKANTLKTYYPCYMQRMSTTDIIPWPSVYVKRSAKRKVHLDFEPIFTSLEVQLDDVNIEELDFKQKEAAKNLIELQEKKPTVMKFADMRTQMMEQLAKQTADAPPEVKKDDLFNGLEINDET